MENLTYLGEGHYQDNNGNQYMSIWTYKRLNNISTGNNYEDALNMPCTDKFFGPFNQSNRFEKGYMYNINCLDSFYS